jgi:hypothetical protein
MATEPPRLAGQHLQVLRVLADAPHGCDVNALLTRGVKLETMADLIQGELATVRVETVEERGSKIEFACVRITDAGRRALQKPRPPEPEQGAPTAGTPPPQRALASQVWGCHKGLALPRFFCGVT